MEVLVESHSARIWRGACGDIGQSSNNSNKLIHGITIKRLTDSLIKETEDKTHGEMLN